MAWNEIALTVLGSILASNGLWGLIAKLGEKKSATNSVKTQTSVSSFK